MKLLTAILILLFLSYPMFAEDKRPDEFPVVSYNNLKTENFNVKIYTALKNGEKWVYNPLLVIQGYRNITDTRFVNIMMRHDRGENPLNSIITVIEEGYLDDSVRGQWFQFYLERKNSESSWKIKEIRQAYLCGRMNSPKEFSKEPCP
ncbi:hypothetical protein [Desulfobulbus alkaliphilus]|uniref:hypothetical protein n=1 Tax=Desulfobulbus alkaliphilus TaxID=869814 RepID=UPI0019667736|nr:hypothetical protein [Desulfobulbus alkaliphilus]MBM9537530.1 hypothetical protein [Desulfobulbus alkaliphilus]